MHSIVTMFMFAVYTAVCVDIGNMKEPPGCHVIRYK